MNGHNVCYQGGYVKNKIILFAAVFLLTFVLLNEKAKGEEKMEKSENYIFEEGVKGPDEYFTGKVMVNMLVTDNKKAYDTQAYDVKFPAKARTYWHSHPGGQLLFVTSWNGYYQEKDKPARLLQKGDVVEIPVNVVHWHGAAPDSEFVHLGVSCRTDKGPAKWFGAVTDEEYFKAVENK